MADETVTPADVIETTTDATATQTTTIDPAEYARMQKALKDANKEAADRRKKLEAYELAEQQKADADKTETQKALDRAAAAETKATEAEAKYQSKLVESATLAAASKAEYGDGTIKQKFIDPDAAYIFIKATNPAITVDEIPEALKGLAKSKPWMLEAANAQQRATTPQDGVRANANLTTAEIEQRRRENERHYRNQ